MSSILLTPRLRPAAAKADVPPSLASSTNPPTASWWLGALILVALAALVLLGVLEWEHYRRVLKSREIEPSLGDRAIIAWLLWSKSVLPLLPVLAIAAVVAVVGHKKLARSLLAVSMCVFYAWLSSDLVLQSLTGNHVLDYLPYLYDTLTATDGNHVQWAGGVSGIAWRFAAVLALTLGGIWALLRLSQRLAEIIHSKFALIGKPSAAIICTTAMVSVAVAAVPAQAMFNHPLLLRRFHTALPVDLSLFIPQANNPSAMAAWLGQSVDASQRGMRIISVLPDPAGDDPGYEQATLHNFSDSAIALDGWRIVDRQQQQHALSGTLPAGETCTITFPAAGLELNNDGDELRLVDRGGQVRHHVKYKGDWVKYGSLISFREEEDLDEFLFRLDQGVQSVYFTMRKDILTPRPVDEDVRVAADSPPNVIYLVLESFRESAVSPELMQRLDAWSQQGLRMKRHYAGSNSSHLGLFTLLYSRSPMVYYPTVLAGHAPQTTHTLRESGYELTFITSGDCTNFRKMDHFLNEERFDRVIVENGADWRDWPARDEHALEHVRRIASQAKRPQFVMAFLMSTHFPYAFPPEWDVHQPSGADAVNRDNWRTFDAEVLHNRYKNAALQLEEKLMRVIESLDPRRNIIVVTGDHGESMGEDGALAHATRPSEVQTRVPLLMVGPGLPAQAVHEPTTHSDVLPTLLHALSGRSVPIRYAHGRDVLSGEPLADQVMLFPYRWKDPYDLLLLRGGDRMQFKIRLDRASVEAYGFCDTSGNLDLSPARQGAPHDAVEWIEAFRGELLRIAQ